MRNIIIAIIVLISLTGYAGAISNVNVSVPDQRINAGDSFDIIININPKGDIIVGWQLNFLYNKSLLKVNTVSEGNFLKQNGASTYFNPGVIDNQAGQVKNVFDAILGAHNVSNPGTFVIFNVTAIAIGSSNINLSNVKIASPEGQSVPLSIINRSVSSYSISDINADWTVDIMDVVSVTQHFGETTNYPYPSYDANEDRIVDILDIIIVTRNII